MLALACAAALALAAPAAAEVQSVELSGGTLEIKAGAGDDAIQVAAGNNGVTVRDSDGVPTAGPPCEGGYPESSPTVTCPRKDVKVVVVELGDGNDVFDGDGKLRFEVSGDKGDDQMDGGDAGDLIEGKLGDDIIDGSEGSDELLGGLDDDRLFGKGGKDVVDGGPGKDRGDAGEGKDKCVGVEKEKKGTCEKSQKG